MTRSDTGPATARTTPAERAFVLGGPAAAALCTAFTAAMGACTPGSGAGMEAIAFIWTAAGAWAFASSLALAIRRGVRHRDWRAFGRCEIPDGTEPVDWTTQTGEYAWMAVAEEHERLMRGD